MDSVCLLGRVVFYSVRAVYGSADRKGQERAFPAVPAEKSCSAMADVCNLCYSDCRCGLDLSDPDGRVVFGLANRDLEIHKERFADFRWGGLRDGAALNDPLWYVCVLLVCYVLYKFLLQIANKRNLPLTCLFAIPIIIGIAALQYGIEWPFLSWHAARGYVAFFLGIELYCFIQKYRDTKWLKSMAFAVLCSCSIPILVSFYLNPLRELIDDWYLILTFLIFPALVVFMLTSKTVERLLDHKIFGTLGALSFEIYIWHVPMMYVCALAAYLVGYPVTYSTTAMLIFIALVVVISPFMYYLVERPATRFLVNRITVHAEEKPTANTNKNIP